MRHYCRQDHLPVALGKGNVLWWTAPIRNSKRLVELEKTTTGNLKSPYSALLRPTKLQDCWQTINWFLRCQWKSLLWRRLCKEPWHGRRNPHVTGHVKNTCCATQKGFSSSSWTLWSSSTLTSNETCSRNFSCSKVEPLCLHREYYPALLDSRNQLTF